MVSVEAGLRMLRSAPAMGTVAAAEAAGITIRDLVIGVERLRGRGRCDQLAAATMAYPRARGRRDRRWRLHGCGHLAADVGEEGCVDGSGVGVG